MSIETSQLPPVQRSTVLLVAFVLHVPYFEPFFAIHCDFSRSNIFRPNQMNEITHLSHFISIRIVSF